MSLELHLNLLFHSEKNKKIAYDFLTYVKRMQRLNHPYRGNEWKDYCRQNNIPIAVFYSVVRKLKKYGLVVKKGGHHNGEYRLGLVESMCKQLESEWLRFLNEN